MKKAFVAIAVLLIFSDAYAAEVDTVLVFSKKMDKAIKTVVIKPSTRQQKFPVIYLLHGHGGSYNAWLKDAPQLVNKADEINAILVMPDGGYNSWYFDSPVDSSVRYETFITQELIPYIDSNYPTKKDKMYRAITGLSMGGHGAFYLAFKHQDLFSAAGSVCGGLDIRPFPNNWQLNKVLGDQTKEPQNWEKHTVINMVEALKETTLQLIFDCGNDDFFLPVNRAMHEKLLAAKVKHDYTERPGTHNGAYWRNSIDYQLLFFRKQFAQ